MKANGLDSARIVAVWMLHGVGVDDELMKGHTLRIRVLHGEKLAIARPASSRAGHIRMHRSLYRRQHDPAARASKLAVKGHGSSSRTNCADSTRSRKERRVSRSRAVGAVA